MAQPNTFEEFCQLLGPTDMWNFESEALKIGNPEDLGTRPSTKGVESSPVGNDNGDCSGQKRGRFTDYQTQELQALFDKHSHPSREQKEELSRKLGLTPLQVRYWCEKRRRKSKGQHKDLEIMLLKGENEKLREENEKYRKALSTPCAKCGGEMTLDERHSIVEIAHLKDDMDAIYTIALKCVKEPPASTYPHLPSSPRSPRQFQAQSSPVERTPVPFQRRGMYHPEWSYLDDELAVMIGQSSTKTPKL